MTALQFLNVFIAAVAAGGALLDGWRVVGALEAFVCYAVALLLP